MPIRTSRPVRGSIFRGISILSLLTLAGCYARYPAAWVPLESEPQDCSSISGAYQGIGSGSRFGAPNLAPRILMDENFGPVEVEKVEIRVGEDVLSVTVIGTDQQQYARKYSAADGGFRCEDGKIHLSDFKVDGWGARRNRTILSQTVAGALVVEDAGEGFGFFVVPIAGSEFLRFEPYVAGQ